MGAQVALQWPAAWPVALLGALLEAWPGALLVALGEVGVPALVAAEGLVVKGLGAKVGRSKCRSRSPKLTMACWEHAPYTSSRSVQGCHDFISVRVG